MRSWRLFDRFFDDRFPFDDEQVENEVLRWYLRGQLAHARLSGMDALVTEARRMSEEMGWVGQPMKSDTALLALLLENRYLPVVACVAEDPVPVIVTAAVPTGVKTDVLIVSVDATWRFERREEAIAALLSRVPR